MYVAEITGQDDTYQIARGDAAHVAAAVATAPELDRAVRVYRCDSDEIQTHVDELVRTRAGVRRTTAGWTRVDAGCCDAAWRETIRGTVL